MRRFGLIMVLAAVWAAAAYAPSVAAKTYEAGAIENPGAVVKVEFLDDKADDLRDAAKNSALSEDLIYSRAAALWGRIPGLGTTDMPPVELRGWQKPKIHTEAYRKNNEQESISIDGISNAVRDTLSTHDIPAPEVSEAYAYGEAMTAGGLKTYDQDRRLGSGVLGVYKYTQDSAVGIFLNQLMKKVQGWAGNEFAAATDLHESAHARDHNKGQLNPVEVKKGEILAYKTEFLWLQMMDPKGEKLSWARATLGKFAAGSRKAPKFVADYLEHLAMIRRFGNKNDYQGLVTALGYRDRPANPFLNAEHTHPQHQCPWHRMAARGDEPAEDVDISVNILPVKYVDLPKNEYRRRGYGRD